MLLATQLYWRGADNTLIMTGPVSHSRISVAKPFPLAVGRVVNILLRSCPETIVPESPTQPAIHHPAFMPREWVTGSYTFRAAINRGWHVVTLEGDVFLLPPKSYWHVLFSDRELTALAEVGIAVPAAPSANGAFTVDDVRQIFLDACPVFSLHGSTPVFSTVDGPEMQDRKSVRQFVEAGGTMVHSDGDLFFVPPEAIRPDGISADDMPSAVPADVVRQLADLGVIGVRGTHRAPWWQPPVLALPGVPRTDTSVRRPSSPDMDLVAFEQRQYDRWTMPHPVVNLDQYPELDPFPELKHWLWVHLPFVEQMDVRRIVNYLHIAESVTTVEHLGVLLNFVHGIMAEIEIRPEIVAHYHHYLESNPALVLVVSPQFFSNDIREASDAMIGEVVTRNGASVLVIHALWEVTSTASGIRAAKVQMNHTLRDRLQDGVYLWSADRQSGLRLPAELAIDGERHLHTDIAHVNGLRARVLQETRDELLTTFLLHWSGHNVIQGSRQVGTFQDLLQVVRSDVASGTSWTLKEFMDALRVADARRAHILENITVPRAGGPLSKRDVALQLQSHEQVVGRMEKELSDVCAEMGWPVLERMGLAGDIERGHERLRGLQDLQARAMVERWDVARMVREMRGAGLELDAALLQNIVAPEAGRRRSPIEMAQDLKVDPPTNVYRWEVRLENLCNDMKWATVAAPQQTRADAMVAGRRARRDFDDLWRTSLVGGWSREVFLQALEGIDEDRATVVRNLTEGFEGRRLSPAELHKRFDLDRQVATNWEAAFEPLCQARGWPVLQRPEETLHHGDRVTAGHELSDKVRALQSEARATSMEQAVFADRLRAVDPVRGAVWERVVHPSGKPATNRELAAELGVPKSNLGNYAQELRTFSGEMGWPPATPNSSPIGGDSGGGVTLAPDGAQMDEQQRSLAPKPGGFDVVTLPVGPLTTPADVPHLETRLSGTPLDAAPLPLLEQLPMLPPDFWKQFAIPPSEGRLHAPGIRVGGGTVPEEIPLAVDLPADLPPPVSLASTPMPRVRWDAATMGLLIVAGLLVVADGPLPIGDAAAASLLGGRLLTSH